MKHFSFPLGLACAAALLLPQMASAQATYQLKQYRPGLTVQNTPTQVPALELSTSAIDFGAVPTNTVETRQVVVSNPGTGPLSFTAAPSVAGSDVFSPGATTCGLSLAPATDCLASVTFSPVATGGYSAVLTFTSTLANSPHEVTLMGTAFNPVSLSSATLPRATVGQAYSYDFKPLLAVSHEGTPNKSLATWSSSGTLPANLSLDGATGVLSGTPTVANAGASFTVVGTYKNSQGQQVYTIKVEGAVLKVRQISAGHGFTCAVLLNDEARCWGDNSVGQLGDGTTVSSLAPVAVAGLSVGVRHIVAGYRHACAITLAGGAKCWGFNGSGQLGDGSTTTRLQAVDVTGLASGVQAIAVNGYSGNGLGHTCAISGDGAAVCWGSNSSGRLGDGTTSSRLTPAQVVGLTSGVTAISAGGAHSCAVHQGAAKCWGAGDHGRLGNNSTTDRNSPVFVQGLGSDIASISSGGSHTCARSHSNSAWCWGQNTSGQVGDGTTTERRVPVAVSGLAQSVASIQAGYFYSCALITSGGMQCWGGNAGGRLGDGTTTTRTLPTPVLGLPAGVQSFTLTASGSEVIGHTCAVLSSGGAQCWGDNSRGQLGDRSTTSRSEPGNVTP